MVKKATITMHIMHNMDNQGKKAMILIITINIINNSSIMTRAINKLNHQLIKIIQNNKLNLQSLALGLLKQMQINQTNTQTKNIITNIINNIMQDIKEHQVSSHLLIMLDTISNNTMDKLLAMDNKIQTTIKVNSNNSHHQQMIMQTGQMESLINDAKQINDTKT